MRKFLAITTFSATAALLAASIALAATPKTSQVFQGSTAHGRYQVTITTTCSGKKCTAATSTTITITAGSTKHPTAAGCPRAGYELPNGTIKQGKFSATTAYTVASGKVLKFTVSGTFTAWNKLKGTVSGVSACGGSDSFSLTGVHNKAVPTIGATG